MFVLPLLSCSHAAPVWQRPAVSAAGAQPASVRLASNAWLPAGADPGLDADGDGLLDAEEERIARAYLPYLSLHRDERCGQAGIVYRLRPHPLDPRRLHMTAVVLFELDCGAKGHVGDDEVFGVTIDPALPAPEGILAVRTIAHKNTICEHIDDCGRCPGLDACATVERGGERYPIVFFSRDKHGAYLSEASCRGACFFTNWCSFNPMSLDPQMVNAGEPERPLARNLTAAGLVTPANGWSDRRVFDFDPWGPEKFGDAARVAKDLVDPRFVTRSCELGPPLRYADARRRDRERGRERERERRLRD